MNTPTPETTAARRVCLDPSLPKYVIPCEVSEQLERERNEWKEKYIQQNKDLGCEQMDPNGTIWDYAKKLQAERDDLRSAIRNLRAAKGRFHTEQAANHLFTLIR